MNFGTKKKFEGGGFSERGDQKTINFENQNVSRSRFFGESPAPRQGDETPPRLIGIFSKKNMNNLKTSAWHCF